MGGARGSEMTLKQLEALYKPPGWQPKPEWRPYSQRRSELADAVDVLWQHYPMSGGGCECGAKFTSEPKLHYAWCPRIWESKS